MPKPSPADIGAANELTVGVDLIRKGFDAFRNFSPNGEIDLFAAKDNYVWRIQVKSSVHSCTRNVDLVAVVSGNSVKYYSRDGKRSEQPAQCHAMGMIPLSTLLRPEYGDSWRRALRGEPNA